MDKLTIFAILFLVFAVIAGVVSFSQEMTMILVYGGGAVIFIGMIVAGVSMMNYIRTPESDFWTEFNQSSHWDGNTANFDTDSLDNPYLYGNPEWDQNHSLEAGFQTVQTNLERPTPAGSCGWTPLYVDEPATNDVPSKVIYPSQKELEWMFGGNEDSENRPEGMSDENWLKTQWLAYRIAEMRYEREQQEQDEDDYGCDQCGDTSDDDDRTGDGYGFDGYPDNPECPPKKPPPWGWI